MIMTLVLPILFSAALALDPPFCDHAVLQRDKPVVVRGSSDAGATVTISFAGNTVRGVADAAGHFFCEDRSLQGRVAHEALI